MNMRKIKARSDHSWLSLTFQATLCMVVAALMLSAIVETMFVDPGEARIRTATYVAYR